MKTISIITAVHNTEKYIGACIGSLLEQTYTELEIILVNDGSDASCSQLLRQLSQKDSRIRLYELPDRQGVGSARNFGLEQATGTFVYFLDSDDYLPEKTLELLVDHIEDAPLIRGRMYTTSFSTSFAIVFDGINQVRTYDVDKFNLLKNNSAQNFLIRRDFIEEHQFAFSEEVEIFGDLAFMVPVLMEVGQFLYVKEALYFRRRRSEPIVNPSLSQQDMALQIRDFLTVYISLKDQYDDPLVSSFLDGQLLNFYRKDVINHFLKTNQIDGFFDLLSAACVRLESGTIDSYRYFFKKEIKTLMDGKKKKYRNIIKRHNFLREFKKARKSKKALYPFVYKYVLSRLKKNEKLVVFDSFQGRSYSDNPKYIYEHMLENDMDFKYVWSMNESEEIKGDPKQVKPGGFRFYYNLARAKYWVRNSRLPNHLDKNKGTIYLQTWHGTPLKRLAGDMEDVHMPGTNTAKYKLNFYHETQKWDYLIAPNPYSREILQRAFWFDGITLDVGYPRNDLLYNRNNVVDIEALKREMGLPLDKKVILYAPTWRDDEFYAKGKYRFNLKLNLHDMQKVFGEEYVVALRMHYIIASELDVTAYEGFAHDFSNYDDIGELYLVSDILITDYSSVFFDYANLKRPILFYTYDLEKYRDSLRGFYIDMENDVPGPLLKTTDEVINAIRHIDQVSEDYKEKYEAFYSRFCIWDDGSASRQTVEQVFK